jgi:hypothetical protein
MSDATVLTAKHAELRAGVVNATCIFQFELSSFVQQGIVVPISSTVLLS